MRACRTTDERLFDFVDGLEPDLESHVETCDYCQDFLAELWVGELSTDLSAPVLRQIRFDEFLRELGQLTVDVATAMARAFLAYGPAADDAGEAESANLLPPPDDEE
ncbi:MAG: hypothetical protein QNJ77_09280 [Acidimicrobiia bacterium]|nr:hypothetical protein [Acidimicrobiia bacterium]